MLESSTDLELHLHAIWAEVLGHDDFGINDDFFAIGGHSLAAFRLASHIEQNLGCTLPLAVIFQNPTIATLAPLLVPLDHEADSGSPGMSIPVVEPINMEFQ